MHRSLAHRFPPRGAALASSIAIAASLQCAGCAQTDRSDPDAAQTLTIGYDGARRFFAPGSDDPTKFIMFLPLAIWDPGCRTGEPTGLAERWEHSADRRRWTFYLRRDVRWHDGVPVTAHDVAFTVALWKRPDVNWYGAWYADSATAVDDHTVTFFLPQPGTISEFTWDVYYPKHLIEDLDPAGFFEWEFWMHPIGNGPYQYLSYNPETHIELEANPHYYRGEPPIRRLRITLGSGESNLIDLLAGGVDIIRAFPKDAERFREDDRFTVHYADLSTDAGVRIVWNLRHPLFEDKAIRRALTLGIDRRELGQALGMPDDAPITDGTYNSCTIERGEVTPPWPYDPAAAERILEAAGWRDRDRDGIRERDGVPFRFEVLTVVDFEKGAVVAQAHLRRIGVAMDVRVMDARPVKARFDAGEFEAALPMIAYLDQKLGLADAPNGYDNPHVRDLWERLLLEDDVEEVIRLHREISAIYHDEIPGTFLYSRMSATVARAWVRGLDSTQNWVAFPDRLSIERKP